jgi:hypothetical protein
VAVAVVLALLRLPLVVLVFLLVALQPALVDLAVAVDF